MRRYYRESDQVQKPAQHRKARLPVQARERLHRGAVHEDEREREDRNLKNHIHQLKGNVLVDDLGVDVDLDEDV